LNIILKVKLKKNKKISISLLRLPFFLAPYKVVNSRFPSAGPPRDDNIVREKGNKNRKTLLA
jgi:hypothetical protein